MPRHLLVPVLAILISAAAAAQEPLTPVLESGAMELSVGGRLQTQLNTTSVGSEPPSQLFIRRARLEIDVRINERVSGAIQPDFGGGEVELKDAYLKLTLSPALGILAGKAYRPFGLLEQTSSKRILLVERGLRIRGVTAADEYALLSGLDYSNREIGIQLLGAPARAPFQLAYAAGVFRGPLHGQVGSQDSYQLAARVTARPFPELRLGAGWSSRDFAGASIPGSTPELRRGHAFEVDGEYGAFGPGLHVLAEVARGDLDPFAGSTFWGAHTWIAYRTVPLGPVVFALEPVLRVSHSETSPDPGTGTLPGGTLLTPGVNVYFTPLNRLMLNHDVWLGADDSGNAQSFKVMFQLGF